MDWKECGVKRIVKDIQPDKSLVSSLIKISRKKMASQELLPLNEITTASKISLAYDSLREVLEALAIKRGFRVYNHECYVAFLKEIMRDSFLGEDFDEIRKLRNEINYYGKDVALGECVRIIKLIKGQKRTIDKYLKEN